MKNVVKAVCIPMVTIILCAVPVMAQADDETKITESSVPQIMRIMEEPEQFPEESVELETKQELTWGVAEHEDSAVTYPIKYANAQVNIRQEADAGSLKLGVLEYGTEIGVVEEIEGWTQVKLQTDTAYIKSEYLQDEKPSPEEEKGIYLGSFRITHYCSCRKCCGKWAGGPTESGRMPVEGVTVAVDKRKIKLGQWVEINGLRYDAAPERDVMPHIHPRVLPYIYRLL